MKVTLLDEKGVELTEITSHLGRSSSQMLVDWASRPDVLFQYYFDRRKRAVTVVSDAATWSAVVDTRWQMGARFWFLREFDPAYAPAQAAEHARSTQDPGLAATSIRSFYAKDANATQRAPAGKRRSEPRGIPT